MVHGENRIPCRIDRRLTGLAGLNMMLPSLLGCLVSPEDSQYGEYRLTMAVITSTVRGRVNSSQPTADAVSTPRLEPTPLPDNDTSNAQSEVVTTSPRSTSSPILYTPTPTQASPTATSTLDGTPTSIPEYTQPVRAIAHCTGKSVEYWLDYVQKNRSLPTLNKELAECYRGYIENDGSGE